VTPSGRIAAVIGTVIEALATGAGRVWVAPRPVDPPARPVPAAIRAAPADPTPIGVPVEVDPADGWTTAPTGDLEGGPAVRPAARQAGDAHRTPRRPMSSRARVSSS
jgi:hypothetical protein